MFNQKLQARAFLERIEATAKDRGGLGLLFDLLLKCNHNGFFLVGEMKCQSP